MNIKIKDLPQSERPRERLINNGAENLSDEEILAIVLKTGTKDISAKILASQILKEIGSIKNLKKMTYQELLKIKGIGPAKACLFLAIIELAKRINKKRENIIDIKITNPAIVYEYFQDLVNETQEFFYTLYLDSNKRILSKKLLFIGTVNQSMVHPRDIYKMAYQVNAVGIICVHNHPTGDVRPSKSDINTTIRLKEVSDLMGVELVDHIIIGKNKYYSFLENGGI